MAGYHGYSMSNNAVEAYDRGGLRSQQERGRADLSEVGTDLYPLRNPRQRVRRPAAEDIR